MISGRLNDLGVLGINARNGHFIGPFNERSKYPLVDDKVKTKELAQRAGIAVPELLHVVRYQHEVRAVQGVLSQHNDFVVKPAHGSGGEGVLVVAGRSKESFRTIDGTVLEPADLEHHVSNILGGMFSLGGHPDQAMIEYRVRFDPVFQPICYLGVPDIRIIVFLGVPVMAMVRLPTRASKGKANLHQGAIGAGISIATGITKKAVWKNKIVTEHPDTGISVEGVTIPRWDSLLNLAAQCYELTGLGIQGVDIVLDEQKGPLILELNARPGLNIQLANQAGLAPRLNLVLEQAIKQDVAARVVFAMANFR